MGFAMGEKEMINVEMPYRGASHLGFAEEWGLHKGCSDRWRLTGYASGHGHMYFYDCCLISGPFLGGRRHACSVSIHDFQSERRLSSVVQGKGSDLRVEGSNLEFKDMLKIAATEKMTEVSASGEDFKLNFSLSNGKGPIWPFGDGCLKISSGEEALCSSFTNMNATCTVSIGGKSLNATGKAWLDKMAGPRGFKKRQSHWEWFSLRFFDNDELLLVSFPESGRKNGAYISKSGQTTRVADFEATATGFASPVGKAKFSSGWEVHVPGIKEERYVISPIVDGAMSLGCYEVFGEVCNESGDQAGMCFAQLLPGVLNEKFEAPFSVSPKLKLPWQKKKNG
jgi:hypothetical protein